MKNNLALPEGSSNNKPTQANISFRSPVSAFFVFAGNVGSQAEVSVPMMDTNILLVDDDKDTCASMSDVLVDLGYTVDTANDGPGALELSERHQYRIALLDYNMPGMNGVELCRRLKLSQHSVVVAIVTAFSNVAMTEESSDAGVQRCFMKPVDLLMLMPFVKEAVSSN